MRNISAFIGRFPAPLALLLGLSLLPVLPGCHNTQPQAPPPLPRVPSSRRPPLGSGSGSYPAQPTRPDDDNLLLGNPSGAGRGPNNFLLEIPQYALAYNESTGGPNWVSWHLEAKDLGGTARSTFHPNASLQPAMQIRPSDYKGSGYDRGHMCPSGDRTDNREDNEATFMMSNMLPQAASLNREVWKRLEEHCRKLADAGNELYIMAGGAGSLGRIAGGKVNIPAACWKVIVVLPRGDNDLRRINAGTRVIAVAMPNKDTEDVAHAAWSQYLVSTARIERGTNLRFFTALPPAVRQALEARVDSGSDDTERGNVGSGRSNGSSVD